MADFRNKYVLVRNTIGIMQNGGNNEFRQFNGLQIN